MNSIDAERVAEIRRTYGHLDRSATMSDEDAILDLLAAYDAENCRANQERDRADDAENWCARLANDREGETALVQVGVAKALAAVNGVWADWEAAVERIKGGTYARGDDEFGKKYGTQDVVEALRKTIKGVCGPAQLPPHEKTLARLRRLEAALADLLSSTDGEMGRRARENARALLAPDPLN